jgi:hypothetical protein
MSMLAPGDCMDLPYFHVTAEERSEGIYPYPIRCIRKKMEVAMPSHRHKACPGSVRDRVGD